MVNTVNIDAGGTFTDGYLTLGDTRTSVKVPTTPHDLTECFVKCIEKGARSLNTDTASLLAETDILRLATTFGTNAILERSGPKIGAIVTAGQEEDVYADGLPEEFLLEPDMVRSVEEGVETDGTITTPIDREDALDEVRELVESGARIIVVALENAAYNPKNEEAIRQAVKERYPQHYLRSIPVQPSTEVTDIPDDRRRTMAAVVNAYIHRIMARNLYKAEDRVRDQGYENPLLAAYSDGGAARIAKTKAINTYSSGPAAGLIGTAKLADHYNLDGVLATDMGGTSVDAAISRGGDYTFEMHPEIADVEVAVPMLRMTSIGAGGGSIAVVEDENLRVGPESAGARPGPACYGLGGDRPTVTDADVVLGYVNPDYFLGGERDLNAEAARKAIDEYVAEPLNIDTETAARRIRDRVDRNIGRDLADLAQENNLDTDEVDALFVFGGAGPLHAADYAEQAGIDRIVTFPFGSVFNAYGQSTMDVQHSYTEAIGTTLISAPESGIEYADTLDEMVEVALRDMEGEGFDADEVTFTVEFVCNAGDGERELVAGAENLDSETAHEIARSYATGSDIDPEKVQLEAVRLTAGVPVPEPEITEHELADKDPGDARKTTRTARWGDGPEDTPIYEYADLQPGNIINGPAVVEATDTTYAVPSGWTYRIDQYANGVLER